MSQVKPDTSLFYSLTRTIVYWFFTTFYDFSTSGTGNIPLKKSTIVAANHISFYDPPAIGANVQRQFNYFARNTLFKGLLGKIIRCLDTIPVARDSADIKSLKAIFKTLNNNGAIVIFPEGTRSPDGKIAHPKPGAGMIACKSKAIIIPTRIFGTFEVFGRQKKLPTLGGPIHITFGQPITIDTIDPGKDHPERYLEVSKRIIAEIAKLEAPRHIVV